MQTRALLNNRCNNNIYTCMCSKFAGFLYPVDKVTTTKTILALDPKLPARFYIKDGA